MVNSWAPALGNKKNRFKQQTMILAPINTGVNTWMHIQTCSRTTQQNVKRFSSFKNKLNVAYDYQ